MIIVHKYLKNGKTALTGVVRLGVVLQSERPPVRFPVRAHAWAVGSVLDRCTYERQPIDVSLSLSPSFPLSLKINK